MNNSKQRKQQRAINNLTGFRGLAAMLILFYHLNSNVFSGAFIAVDIFLILSGFLTVYQFNLEYEATGKINKLKYFKKRLIRIYPNLIFMLFSVYAIYTIIAPYQLVEMKNYIVTSLLGVVNYNYIFANVDYFAASTVVNPFGHIWALALEMQFYVVAPFIYMFVLNHSKKNSVVDFTKSRRKERILFLYFIAMLIMPISYFITGGNTTIAYYGSLNRFSTLLLGMFIAWNFSIPKMDKEYKESKVFHDIFTILITIALFIACFVIVGTQTFLYKYGFIIIDLILAYYLWAITSDKNILTPIYSSRMFKYLGTRSYGIYLWHLPFIAMFQYEITLKTSALIIICTFIMAEATYQFFDRGIFNPRPRKFKYFFSTIGLSMVLFLVFEISLFVKSTETYSQFDQDQYVEVAKDLDYLNNVLDNFNNEYTAPETQVIDVKNQFEKYKEVLPTFNNYTNIIIGDSVMRQLTNSLDPQFEEQQDNYVDVQIGLQADELLTKLQKYAFLDSSETNLLFNVGNNGPIGKHGLDEMIELYPNSNIYVLDLISDQEWTSKTSEVIHNAADKYDNVHLVPIRSLLDDNENLLLPDHLHYSDETIIKVKHLFLDTYINQIE